VLEEFSQKTRTEGLHGGVKCHGQNRKFVYSRMDLEEYVEKIFS
jgi:hypothetical protein